MWCPNVNSSRGKKVPIGLVCFTFAQLVLFTPDLPHGRLLLFFPSSHTKILSPPVHTISTLLGSKQNVASNPLPYLRRKKSEVTAIHKGRLAETPKNETPQKRLPPPRPQLVVPRGRKTGPGRRGRRGWPQLGIGSQSSSYPSRNLVMTFSLLLGGGGQGGKCM